MRPNRRLLADVYNSALRASFGAAKPERSQTSLAHQLRHKTLTQPILGSILRGKRPLHEFEARETEKAMGIRDGWVDEDEWLKDGWKFVKIYPRFDPSTQKFANDRMAFPGRKARLMLSNSGTIAPLFNRRCRTCVSAPQQISP